MFEHLHTGTPAPIPFLKLIFYREFGWTPDELARVPLPHVQELLTVMNAEAAYHEQQRKKREKK